MTRVIQSLIFGFCIFPIVLMAKEVGGVPVPESVSLSENSAPLTLNGAGIRTKFFFDIYVGSLYLNNLTKEVQEVLADPNSKRVSMFILYDELAKEKITSAWTDGFEDNNSDEELNLLKERLLKFNEMFTDLTKGDVVHMDYLPSQGTQLTINNNVVGIIAGHDFNVALLKVWLGDSPADSDLKEAMLGVE